MAVAVGRPDGIASMIILCADDYAITEGVSRAIGELAAAQRLSATSVLVTSTALAGDRSAPARAPPPPERRAASRPDARARRWGRCRGWPGMANSPGCRPGWPGAARPPRSRGDPGRDRAPARPVRAGLRLSTRPHRRAPARARAARACGSALLESVQRRYPSRPPLIRDPIGPAREPSPPARMAAPKALMIARWRSGFARAARERGLPINDSFAGFSDFDVRRPYADELGAALLQPGRRHLVMCHPGHPDAELAEPRPHRRPAAHGVRGDHARSGPAAADLAALARCRRAGARMA